MPTKKTLTSIPPWLVLMGSLAAIGPLAVDMYLPSFGAIAADLNISVGQVERTLASYLLGLAFAQLAYGPLADRFGRKIPLIGGLILFIIASLACASTADIEHLTLWRIVQAFGGASGMVVPRAVIRDHLETRDAAKALSLLMLIMGVMPIVAPLLGGQVVALGSWRIIFYIMAGVATIQLIAVVIAMRESLSPNDVIALRPSIIACNYLGLLRHKKFVCYALAGGFGTAGMFAYIVGSPRVFITIYDVEPRYFGLLFGLNALSLILASQLSARMLNRREPGVLLCRAQIVLVVMTLIALAITLLGIITLPLLMLCLMGFMASQGFVSPNAAALALNEQGHRLGVASAMMGTLQMLCGAGAGMAVSAWQSTTPLPLTGMLAACAVLSWLFGRAALRAT